MSPRSRHRGLWWTFIGLVFSAVVGAGIVAGLSQRRLSEPFRGYEGERFVDVPPGMAVGAIAERLAEAGVVQDEVTFRLAVWWTGRARTLKAGEYRFDRPMTVVEVIDKIARGDVYLRPVTFPEGLTIPEMAAIFARQGLGKAESFVEAAGEAALVTDLDPEAADLEGYLFPDTYSFPRTAGAEDVVRAMVAGFRRTLDASLLAEATTQGRTVREVVTLASLIEKETAKADERALVSAVYTNRLRVGMGLQCDPTVIYALSRADLYDGNLTRENLMFDSPYNTYRYAGLPPGPIAAPGKASIEAALRPAEVGYLYFVSRNDGTHMFATTLAEHNRNVREHQVRYFRELGKTASPRAAGP